MAEVHVPKLYSICKSIHESDPVCEELAGHNYRGAAHKIVEEITFFRNVQAEPIPVREASKKVLEPMLSACEIATVHLIDLAIICFERANIDQQLLWPGVDESRGTLVLKILSTNLANTLLGTRHLVLVGLDAEARVLLRRFVELADLTVAISSDWDCFSHYTRRVEGFKEDYKNWSDHLKPGKIREVVSRLHQDTQGMGMSEELVKVLKDTRKGTYDWLSRYSHASFPAQIASAIGGVAEDDRLIPKFGVGTDEDSKATMFRAALYSWIACTELIWLFSYRHYWPSLANKENDAELRWFCYRSEVLKQFTLFHYTTMMETAQGEDSGGDIMTES